MWMFVCIGQVVGLASAMSLQKVVSLRIGGYQKKKPPSYFSSCKQEFIFENFKVKQEFRFESLKGFILPFGNRKKQ